jgi:catechol 2,3-dioxygenase-like lactoylglutathione lyase family enzyme
MAGLTRSTEVDHGLTGLDHVIVGVRDLEAARAQYARLGFNSTPRGRHVGWGTANYCIMFPDDYVELLGIVDPTQFTNDLDRFLADREGLLSLALGSADLDATREMWLAAGLEPAEPRALGRLLEAEGAAVELRFRNLMLPRASTSGLSVFALEHLTPEPMRRPAWLAHPNGAVAIRSCTICASDTAPAADVLRRLFGAAAIIDTDNVIAAHTGHGVIMLAPPEDAQLIYPLLDLPEQIAEPRLVAMSIRVIDPDRAAAFLRLQGVSFQRDPSGAVLIPPAEAHGLALELAA